ncbi:hypothetical protein COY95_02360 [Candidatus Woesearchaeota archaeon CG_4_10_14_0_8_um_filter_47_5]|nr:MAG: hypothetical protein COY95_02360 [Candidatus Woesearchaeota archaeon CG_4_10_14_0_8_um_filter_47_5]
MADVTKTWRGEVARLRDIDGLIALMDSNIERNPVFYRERMRLLDEFFAEHPSPVDIVVVMYGALFDAHHLAYHLQGNNLLFYRPKASHNRVVETAFLEGDIHTERTLLIFDGDMVTGNAMRETADFFLGLGYNRKKRMGISTGGASGDNIMSLN